MEMRLRFPRAVAGAESQVLLEAVGLDDLARVHLPVWVPDRLELAESADQLFTEHFVEELAARLAIAVLAAQTAAVADTQVGGLFHERAPVLQPRLTGEVKIDAAVDTALAEVAIHRW